MKIKLTWVYLNQRTMLSKSTNIEKMEPIEVTNMIKKLLAQNETVRLIIEQEK